LVTCVDGLRGSVAPWLLPGSCLAEVLGAAAVIGGKRR
jgi:hypothetical protein